MTPIRTLIASFSSAFNHFRNRFRDKAIKRLVVISNRLPIVIEKESGQCKVSQGSGGLVTAFAPVLRNRKGVWIGWPGNTEALSAEELEVEIKKAEQLSGFTCCPIALTKEDIEQYYLGFSNEIIWPLFHDLQSICNFEPDYWKAYQKVNEKFAATAIGEISTSDFVWVQDYHLMLLGQELRKRNPTLNLAFFLHIPFPPLDIFLKLPWRFQIIRALLEYDCLGFQTARDKRNFIQCVKTLLPDVRRNKLGALHVCKTNERKVFVGAFPISIDYDAFHQLAQSQSVVDLAQHIRETIPEKTLILSIDRLDYTKGIPYRLKAFRCLLERYPEVRKKVTLVQVTVPSRIDIPHYETLKAEIDRLVSEINSKYTEHGWIPIHYIFRSLTPMELVAHYRTSEIALVTSLKDGMNLVAKEYVACNIEKNGVLILSEFAGASSQLHDQALLVNPYDTEGVADTIFRALNMPAEERAQRIWHMQQQVKHYGIFWWVQTFLEAAINKKLNDFSPSQEYIPKESPPQ